MQNSSINELKESIKKHKAEIDKLEKSKQKVLTKKTELQTNLKDLESKENSIRISALISCLTIPTILPFVPIIGVWLAALPVSLLAFVIIQSVKLFKTEDKIEKTKKDCETCDELLKSYDEDIVHIKDLIKHISNLIDLTPSVKYEIIETTKHEIKENDLKV